MNPSTGAIILPNRLARPTSGPSGHRTFTAQISAANPTALQQKSITNIHVLLAPSCFLQAPQQPQMQLPPSPPRNRLLRLSHEPYGVSLQQPKMDGQIYCDKGSSNALDISENLAVGSSIGIVNSTRTGQENDLSFRIISGDPDRHFFIDPSTYVHYEKLSYFSKLIFYSKL